MINVEIWSDYVCPFCYIGKKEFENAVEELGLQSQVNVINRAFLLDPSTPLDSEELMLTSLQKKYGMPMAQVKEMCDQVTARAATVGLTYNFDTMKVANTLYAHKLVKWAATLGKEQDLNERLLKAYFIEGASIGNLDVLKKLVAEVGLDDSQVENVLNNPIYSNYIEEDVLKAQQIGVRGVPLFLINDSIVISGAQPKEAFKELLLKVATENGLLGESSKLDIMPNACTIDGCD